MVLYAHTNKQPQVFISGKLQSRKYTGQDGVERTAVSILANQMQMLGSRQDGQQAQAPQGNYPQNGYGQGQNTAYHRNPQGQMPPPNLPQPQNGGYAPQGYGVADDNMPF